MSFSLDTGNTKYLPNYAAAVAHHDSIKPIRGSDCRPMAERTKRRFNIRKENGNILVRLHSTDIVTYTPDNRVTLNMSRWATTSTRAAIYAVTAVWTHGGIPVWIQRGSTHHVFKNGCQFDMSEYRSPKIIDPIYPVIHTLNRKAMNTLRKNYAPFITHLKGFIKLVGEGGFTDGMMLDVAVIPWGGASAMLALARGTPVQMLELARGTHVQMHEAAGIIVRRVRTYGLVQDTSTRYGHIVRLKDALAEFDKRLIIVHADEVLTRSTVTDGRKVKDRYAWAVTRAD